MEKEDNNSISKISNKEKNYKYDNYGNVMADSIEDLIYDKYMKKNKPIEENNSKEISISSSNTERKEKDDDITVSKRINLQYNDKKLIKNDSSSSKDILELINENKQSESGDKFLDSINEESEIERNNNNNKSDEIKNDDEKLINTMEENDDPKKEGKQDDKYDSNQKVELILNVNRDSNDNINANINDNNDNNNNSDNNKSCKYNKNSDEISKDSNNNRASESTKVNSKKGNINIIPEINMKKRIKNIRKIHLNNSPSETDSKNSKVLQNSNTKKLISNIEEIKEKNNYIIKLDLNLNDTKEEKTNYLKVLTNVINTCYFCTKELIEHNKKHNSNDSEKRDDYNNKNRGSHNNLNDNENDNNINVNVNLNKNKSEKFLKENPEMYAELDLDKYNKPSNIKIRITNPYYHLFKNNKNISIFKDYKTYTLKKVHKSKSTKDMQDNNYYVKKDRNTNTNRNLNANRVNNMKKLGPLKIKRKMKTNNNTLNKNSTKNDFNYKNDNTINLNDYKYFHNKAICNALAHKSGKKCESCLCILNQKREEEKKNLIPNRKLNLKNTPNSRNMKNIKLIDEDYGKNNYFNENVWDKTNVHSSSRNKMRKNKKRKISKRKNYSNNGSKNSSTNYANVINIDFPLLKSYFH